MMDVTIATKSTPTKQASLRWLWYGHMRSVGAKIAGVQVRAACLVLALLLPSVGCQRWPGTTAMRQYQLESDRLLSEFRAQKKRAEELEQRNVQLEQRLGETEKMLARLQGRSGSRLADSSGGTSTRSGPDRTLTDLGTPPGTRKIPGSGLPDIAPGPPGRLTSGVPGGNDDLRGDPNRPSQWRPIPGR